MSEQKGRRTVMRGSMPIDVAPVAATVVAAATDAMTAATNAAPEPPTAELPTGPRIAPAPSLLPDLPAAAPAEAAMSGDLVDFRHDALAAVAASQAAVARGWEAIAAEMTALARIGIAAASGTATAMLGIKTLTDVIEINAGFARRSVDTMIGGSAKLSEIGVRTATEASRPILSHLGERWKSCGYGG